jgi:inosine-uridine nucleoside N-ribohydrolase
VRGYLFLVVCGLSATAAQPPQPEPVPFILDTDLGPDCDDAGAAAVLNALAIRGEAKILGAVCNTTSKWCAPALQAIFVWYHRDDVPVGTLKGPGNPGGSAEWYGESFNRYIAERSPNRLHSGKNAPDAVAVYRRALASQPDGSVVIASVGNTTNLRDLLRSKADANSPLNSLELVRRKVKLLSVMGGTFPVGPPKDPNLYGDLPASQELLEKWPTPIMFSGIEIGKDLMTGDGLSDATPPSNPVRIAYEHWDAHFWPIWDPKYHPGRIKPHSTYDQTAVLYGVRGLAGYWNASDPGTVTIGNDGATRWTAAPNGNRRYLIEKMSRKELAAIIEDLMKAPATRAAAPASGRH